MDYFRLFFDDVHPYVPVICRSHFYYQWHHERHLISPLLLEAIFACAGRIADDPAQGAQWLALANRKIFFSPRVFLTMPTCKSLTPTGSAQDTSRASWMSLA